MGPKSGKRDTPMIGVWEISSCHDFTASAACVSHQGLLTRPALSRALIIPILQIKKPRLGRPKTASLLFFGDGGGRIILSGNLANNVDRSKKNKYTEGCWMFVS